MSGISPYKIKKAFLYLKHFGWKEFWNHVRDRMEPEDIPYDPWLRSHSLTTQELDSQRGVHFPKEPLISVIVPAYRTPKVYLEQLIESVQAQTYGNFELCIADASKDDPVVHDVTVSYAKEDSRIRLLTLPGNAGISENTNAAVREAKGDYLAFLDHDDLIAPEALFCNAEAISGQDADLLYSDEDKVRADLSKYYQPHFKPDFNLDLLRSNNYITHFLVVKRALFDKIGGFDPSFDGAQDYDFIFRAAEMAEKTVHISRILYHWRTHEASTADNPMSKQYAYDAGKRAIEGNLRRMNVKGSVECLPDFGFYRVHYPVAGEPLISVIIPNQDHADLLTACLQSLLANHYKNLEILIVENNSKEEDTFACYRKLSQNEHIHVITYSGSFNYSAINNLGVSCSKGEYLLFLNNDIRATITDDWLTEMLGVCERADVGAVGAKLYYPDDTVQHAGCVIGIGGIAGAMFVGLKKGRSGYMHKASILQDMSAVTAACMLTKREVFLQAGGFTEDLAVAFNDIDLCLKIGKNGKRIVYDPYAELYHEESKTRGPEDSVEKVRRFQSEIEYMRSHWLEIIKNGDPNYNCNLSLKKWNYSLRP